MVEHLEGLLGHTFEQLLEADVDMLDQLRIIVVADSRLARLPLEVRAVPARSKSSALTNAPCLPLWQTLTILQRARTVSRELSLQMLSYRLTDVAEKISK